MSQISTQNHSTHFAPPLARLLRQHMPFAVLAIALVAFVASVATAFGQSAAIPPSQPPVRVNQWTTLSSQSSAAIIAAAQRSPLFTVNRSGNGDYLHDLSHLGYPQLVSGYSASTGKAISDYYIIPVLDAHRNSIGAVVLALDGGHHAVLLQSIDTYAQPRPLGAVAQMPLVRSEAIFMAQTRLAMPSQMQPRLVYFNFDFQRAAKGSLAWHGGGAFPDDPIWLMPGVGGHDYLVGTNGQVYQPTQLPTAQG